MYGPNISNPMNYADQYKQDLAAFKKWKQETINYKEKELMEQRKQEAGLKYDLGKPQLSLLPYASLAQIAEVLEFGAKKYGRDNWKGGMTWSRLADGVLRHMFAWVTGHRKDPETGLSHLAHAGCGILFLLSYEQTKAGTDDLPEVGKKTYEPEPDLFDEGGIRR